MKDIVIRIYFQSLFEKEGEIHPQLYVQQLGVKVLKYEAVGIADCVFMQIDKPIENKPDIIKYVDFDFH